MVFHGVNMWEHIKKSRSVSSSTKALESDHARYVTRNIVQHARSMATGTRSLPTDSPIPYFQPIDRGYMSEGSQEDVYVTPYVDPSECTVITGGTDYHPELPEIDKVSIYTGLDDYDTLFAARHGRGALDPVPWMSGPMMMTTSMGIPLPVTGPELVNPMERVMPAHNIMHSRKKEQVSLPKDTLQPHVVSPSSEIIGEGAAVFTDMTETILDVLDKQVAMSPGTQQIKGLSSSDNQTKRTHGNESKTSIQKEGYPDLFLPVVENYRISDCFCGYSDSLSADNNPMVLVELNNLSYQYGTSIYAVDRVNGTMYGKFSVGYKSIPEKATVIPQYQQTPVEDEYRPTYENTLPEITNIATLVAKSTPVTQASQILVIPNVTEGDIIKPVSSELARAAYLEWQIQDMSSVWLPLNIPSMEEESHAPTDLSGRIHTFCREWKEKRKQEWESYKIALDVMKESKGKQLKQSDKKEREIIYSQMAQNMEKTRNVVRNSISWASTISAEEWQMALTEKEFSMIKRKMDKIDHRLDELYRNWHAEYGNANTMEECEEIKRFYKPYLEKYKSKYRVLYHLLCQPSLISTHEDASGMTPKLATLDDAPSLKQKEWIRSEPGEDVPCQYLSIGGCLMPTMPRHEDMRIEPSLNVTPEGSIADRPTAVEREKKSHIPEEGQLGTSSETSYMEIPNTCVKTVPESPTRETSRIIPRTKEASRKEALATMQQFFAAVDREKS